MIYIGADHRGYDLKNNIINIFKQKAINYLDCGNTILDLDDDYPDFAFIVGENVAKDKVLNKDSIGILICRSGEGMTIAANKVKGIRAALCHNIESAHLSREDNNANILVLDCLSSIDVVLHITEEFVNTEFSTAPRHLRRVLKITNYENKFMK